ncbi:MAG: segregation/condensation protein A [Peptostreptococcus sp.]|uniref:segregation and condensation protein A n=1 Tax=Peptostreptococcus TaxID=1257 RepID=UPI001CB515CE|nr:MULTISPECIES: segregation/condensation protein A [Peptostreptococcus]MBF1057624.1 segregation/condensation protein A [Peptostreptococcus sp.]
MDYSIQTKKYEGPMELLFDLISRNKIDIRDISIVEITNQYMEYVDHVKSIDMDLASDFIMMATRLLEIKSRYILYVKDKGESEQDPRQELIDQIEEYKKYRQIAEEIKDKIKEYDNRFYRQEEELELEEEDDNLDLSRINLDEIESLLPDLFKILDQVKKNDKGLEKNPNLKKIVENRTISVEDRIKSLRSKIKEEERLSFIQSLESQDKKEVIASFLAMLELIKLKEIEIIQDKKNKDIIIIKREGRNE